MNYFPLHIGDYDQATAHLTAAEDGMYGRLLRRYYKEEQPLPGDIEKLARLMRVRDAKERAALETVLSEFFEQIDGCWAQRRCEEEIRAYQAKQGKARGSARARWDKGGSHPAQAVAASDSSMRVDCDGNADAMRTHSDGNADAMRTHSDGNATRARPKNQEPRTKNQKKNTGASAPPPDGVSESVWSDFMKLRKAKRAPITDTAIERIRVEATKAGLTLHDAISMCCARGWQGFEAAWVLEGSAKQGTRGHEQPPSVNDRDSKAAVEAEALAKGLPVWNGMEQWTTYLAKVRGTPAGGAA